MDPHSQPVTPVDELIASLRADGWDDEADFFYTLVYKTAWTTGAELLGELGVKLREFKRSQRGRMSALTTTKVEESLRMVQGTWPKSLRSLLGF